MNRALRSWKPAAPDSLWLPGLVFTGITVFYMFLGVHDGRSGLVADDAIYLLMADAWSPYFSDLAESAGFVSEHVRFPPLYPALLALSGAGSRHLLAAHAITVGFLLASLVVYFLWLRREFGNNGLATILMLAVALLPTTQIHALDLWSEHLYLLLSVCALAVARDRTLRGWLIVALLVSAAAMTRTVGITLVAAFVASVWLTPAPRRLWLTVAVLAPVAAWAVINWLDATDDSNVAFLFSRYHDAGTQGAWPFIAGNAQALWHGWRTSFDIVGTAFGPALAVIFAGSWIAGWLVRIRRLHFDAIYVFFYLGIIVVWPNDDHARRFLFPLLPVALFQCLVFLYRLPAIGTHATPRLYGAGFAVLLILGGAPSNAAMVARLFSPIHQEIGDFRHTKVWLAHINPDTATHNLRMLKLAIQSYEITAQYVPPGECVFSVHPEMFMYYARRSSYAPPVPAVPDNQFQNQIQRCRYVHLLWMTTHPYLAPGYPGERIDGGTVSYRARWKVSDRVATYAELIDLGPGKALLDDVRDSPDTAVARTRSHDQALRPGRLDPDTDGVQTCIAACP